MRQPISQVMTRGVQVPDQTVRRAAQLMDELNVGSLPVCDGKRLVGMLTDRDITVRATAAGMAPDHTRVDEVMSAQTRWCTEDQSVDDVLRQMSDAQVRRIPVVDATHGLVGIVSLGDLAEDKAGDVASALRDISSPAEPDRA